MAIRYLQNAWHYLNDHARPFERVAFQHAFQHGPISAVLEALQQYQNEDGGFQAHFEPDNRTSASSALATSVALREARRLGMSVTEPMVQFAVKYLLDTLDQETMTWRIIPQEAQNAPHAPWWDNTDGTLIQRFSGCKLNPRADLLGSLWVYQELVPEEVLVQLTDDVLKHAEHASEMHDLICLAHLLGTEEFPEVYRAPLLQVFRERVLPTIPDHKDAMQGYVLLPLQIADTPEHPLAFDLEDAVQTQLDLMLETQSPQGHWEPGFSWGNREADQEWKSILTFQNVSALQAWGL
ncbi:hypothetical protein [Deinococcus cellulosilyticus]|nr:hypothetical protein [Deinococcus cellulosilyticus]